MVVVSLSVVEKNTKRCHRVSVCLFRLTGKREGIMPSEARPYTAMAQAVAQAVAPLQLVRHWAN